MKNLPKLGLTEWDCFQLTSMVSSSECSRLAKGLKQDQKGPGKLFGQHTCCQNWLWRPWWWWPRPQAGTASRTPPWSAGTCTVCNQVRGHILVLLTCQRSQSELEHRPCSFRFPPLPTSIRLDYQKCKAQNVVPAWMRIKFVLQKQPKERRTTNCLLDSV